MKMLRLKKLMVVSFLFLGAGVNQASASSIMVTLSVDYAFTSHADCVDKITASMIHAELKTGDGNGAARISNPEEYCKVTFPDLKSVSLDAENKAAASKTENGVSGGKVSIDKITY